MVLYDSEKRQSAETASATIRKVKDVRKDPSRASKIKSTPESSLKKAVPTLKVEPIIKETAKEPIPFKGNEDNEET